MTYVFKLLGLVAIGAAALILVQPDLFGDLTGLYLTTAVSTAIMLFAVGAVLARLDKIVENTRPTDRGD